MSQRLSNHFSACRLVSLAKIKGAVEFPQRDTHGPYLILQQGYEPGDATMRPGEYLLGRSGAWLGTHWFVRMPVPDRRKEFIFSTVAEVMEMMENLTSTVEVIREKPSNVADDATADVEMQEAIRNR